ncbi:MAG: OmpA family protein [Pseudomonadota bacterium]
MRALLLALALALPAGAMDLPPALDAGAPEDAVLTAHADRSFDSYGVPVAAFGGDDPATQKVQGRLVWSAFRLVGETSVAEVIASYRTRLASRGFEPLWECRTEACGGFDFRFEAELLPAPGMLLDTADFAQLSMRRRVDGSYASILVSRVLDAVHIQTVMVAEAEAALALTDQPSVETERSTTILPQSEKALYDRLIADGHVPIEGLEFETGGAALSPNSTEALDLLGRLLNRNEIAVVIVGHSDNVGELLVNIDLSRRRAEAVRDALAARGVPPEQMSASGAGFLAPITSNASPEGRERNRRVELVLR